MTDIRQNRRPLWLIAQDFINVLFSIFGQPEEIAARHTMMRDQWQLLSKWLRAGEALMRMLLLIEAAALPKPNTRPLLRPKRTRKKRIMSFYAEEPDTWRVSFRVFVPTPPGRSAKRGEPGSIGQHAAMPAWPGSVEHAARFKSAWPLAERAEALLRVFNDPAAAARRLSRRLYAVPHRARALLDHKPELAPLVGVIAFGTVRDAAWSAPRVFDG